MLLDTYKFIQQLKLNSNYVRLMCISTKPSKLKRENVLINCKRPKYNHYKNTFYNNLNELPLASKGWNHTKSKGDYFIINNLDNEIDEKQIPFENLNINVALIDILNKNGIKLATNFQAEAISKITDGNHLLLSAETGCGKTIAYLLPIIQNLIQYECTKLNTPKALIIVPNRELVYQIGEIAEKLSNSVGLKIKTLTGGRTKKLMLNPEYSDIDILIATPGALSKLSTIGIFNLSKVLHTVLDEADTLIDNSFIERINSIMKKVPQSQIILVSATIPTNLPDILEPIKLNLDQVFSPKLHKPLLNIKQKFLRLGKSTKPGELLKIVKNNEHPMIIFTNRNETCNWLALYLRENNIPCSNINGNMNYAIRIQQWEKFLYGENKILSATDVASRGLNTIQVRHILNYDFPFYISDYIHRIGRIGRFGSHKMCVATNFISGYLEIKLVQQIETAIRKNLPFFNVDGNITNLIQKSISNELNQKNIYM